MQDESMDQVRDYKQSDVSEENKSLTILGKSFVMEGTSSPNKEANNSLIQSSSELASKMADGYFKGIEVDDFTDSTEIAT